MIPTSIDVAVSKRWQWVLLLAMITGFTVLFSPLESKAAPGDLDTGFGTDGQTSVSVVSGVRNDGEQVAIQKDGKIVVVGTGGTDTTNSQFAVMRLDANGDLDTGFGTGGTATVLFATGGDDRAFAVAIQDDGKIVIAGGTGVGTNNGRIAAAQLDTNGVPDSNFSGDGLLIVDPPIETGFSEQATAVALQADGKIVIVGSTNIGSANNQKFAVVRLYPDGTLDATTDGRPGDFGGDGKVSTAVATNTNDGAQSVAIQADGKIVAAGFSELTGTQSDFALVRWESDGNPDVSFGVGSGTATGTVTIGFSSIFDQARGIGIQPDGKIVVAGYQGRPTLNETFAVARLNTDGSLDTSFGSDGKTTTSITPGARDGALWMAIQNDGKIVAAGTSAFGQTNSGFAVARYLADTGGLNDSFGTNGRVTTDFGGPDDRSLDVAVHTNGRIVAAGFSQDPGDLTTSVIALARYTRAGDKEVDRTDVIPTTNTNRANAVAIQGDGKTVVVGVATSTAPGGNADFAVARYEDDVALTLDASFNSSGHQTTDLSGDDVAQAVVVQSDQKIIVGGASDTETSDSDFALARYNSDGSLDASDTYDSDDVKDTIDSITALAVQSDGKIVAAGYTDRDGDFKFAVLRFNADLSLDTNFGLTGDGIVVADISPLNDRATAVLIQADGKIVAVGVSNESSLGGPGGAGGERVRCFPFHGI